MAAASATPTTSTIIQTQVVTADAVAVLRSRSSRRSRPGRRPQPRRTHARSSTSKSAANKVRHAAGQDHRAAQRRQDGRLPVLRAAAPQCQLRRDLPRERASARPDINLRSRSRQHRYPSAKDAHNGFVRLSEKEGTNFQQDSIVGQAPGLCFETHFYAKDHGTDWACAFSKGTTAVVVRTVVVRAALNALLVARAVAARV